MQQRYWNVSDKDDPEAQGDRPGGDHHGQDAPQLRHRRHPEQCRHLEEVCPTAGEKT